MCYARMHNNDNAHHVGIAKHERDDPPERGRVPELPQRNRQVVAYFTRHGLFIVMFYDRGMRIGCVILLNCVLSSYNRCYYVELCVIMLCCCCYVGFCVIMLLLLICVVIMLNCVLSCYY